MTNKGNILVSGGTGYIGSHTAIELINFGYNPIIVDSLLNSDEDTLDRIEKITGIRPEFYNIDLCDKEKLFSTLGKKDIDGVIHFAAFKSVNESVAEPLKYYHNNIESLINLLYFCKEKQIKSFVFSSSCTVYGSSDDLPVKETTQLSKPSSPYGNTKQICESILTDFYKTDDSFKIILLRYFNPAGAHPSGLNGEMPRGIPNNLMPYVTQTGYGIRKKLNVFGGDYNTKDGTAIRDYIHVCDLAEAHIKAYEFLKSQNERSTFEIFNLGSGSGYTIIDVIQSFEKTSGQKLPYEIVERRKGDIEKIWADTTKAENILNFKPKMTLDDITKTAWAWEVYYRENIENNKK